VKKHGEERASWYVGWIDPEGKRRCKSCGPGEQGKRNADKKRRKVEAELTTGTYTGEAKLLWEDFRKEWEAKIAGGMEPSTLAVTIDALNHFERLTNPARIWFISAKYIDHYIALRREERGRRRGSLVSVATINKELRHIRAVLRIAADWPGRWMPPSPACTSRTSCRRRREAEPWDRPSLNTEGRVEGQDVPGSPRKAFRTALGALETGY
jgi:hypothetical protein